jgi:hypothetical protein
MSLLTLRGDHDPAFGCERWPRRAPWPMGFVMTDVKICDPHAVAASARVSARYPAPRFDLNKSPIFFAQV